MNDFVLDPFNPEHFTLWLQSTLNSIFIILFLLYLGYRIPVKHKKTLAQILGSLLLLRFVFEQIYLGYHGVWFIHKSLPLHLCGISSILAGVLLIRFNQTLFEFIVLLGIPSAIHSFLTPQFTQGFGPGGYLFYDYYISHGGILLSSLYICVVLGHNIRYKSWFKIFIGSQLLIPIISFINIFISYFYLPENKWANYLYLCDKPSVPNPFIIGEWPWYIVIIEFIAFLHIIAVYYLFKLRGKIGV